MKNFLYSPLNPYLYYVTFPHSTKFSAKQGTAYTHIYRDWDRSALFTSANLTSVRYNYELYRSWVTPYQFAKLTHESKGFIVNVNELDYVCEPLALFIPFKVLKVMLSLPLPRNRFLLNAPIYNNIPKQVETKLWKAFGQHEVPYKVKRVPYYPDFLQFNPLKR